MKVLGNPFDDNFGPFDRPKNIRTTQKILLPFLNYYFFISEIFVLVRSVF
jgi:hypothetical protein